MKSCLLTLLELCKIPCSEKVREKWRTSKFTILITWLTFPSWNSLSITLLAKQLICIIAGCIYLLCQRIHPFCQKEQKRTRWNSFLHSIFAFLATANGMHFAHEKSSHIYFDFALFSIVLGLFGSRWRPVQNTGCFSVCKPCWHKKSLQENGTKLVSKLTFSFSDLHFNIEDLLMHWSLIASEGEKDFAIVVLNSSVRNLPALKQEICTKRHMFVILCFPARSSDVVVFYNL